MLSDHVLDRAALEVVGEDGDVVDLLAGPLLLFQRILIFRAFEDAEVILDRVELGCLASLNKIWNCNGRKSEKANDRNDDHYGLISTSVNPFILFTQDKNVLCSWSI